MRWRPIFFGALVVVRLCSPASGQAQYGDLRGTVTNARGVPISGVEVTAKDDDTGWSRRTTTRGGRYGLTALPARTYLVTFVSPAAGCAARSIAIRAGATARLDMLLAGEHSDSRGACDATVPDSVVLPPRDSFPQASILFGEGTSSPALDTGAMTTLSSAITAYGQGMAGSVRDAEAPLYSLGTFEETWWVDGARFTTASRPPPDRAAMLAGPAPFRRDPPRSTVALREVSLLPAGGGVSAKGPGLTVSVVKASGGNRFSGRAQSSIADHRLQWDNITPALRAQGAGSGSPIQRVSEVAASSGGPLRRGRSWFHAAISRRESSVGIVGFYLPRCLDEAGTPRAGAAGRPDCLGADTTSVTEIDAKLQQQWSAGHRTTVAWGKTDRRKPNRGASSRTRPEATSRQRELGAAQPLQLQHQWVVAPGLVLDAQYVFHDASFVLDFQEPRLAGVQPAYDRYTLTTWRSGVRQEFGRPVRRASVEGSLLAGGRGQHVVKFGAERETGRDRELTQTGGGAVAVFDSRSGPVAPYQARVFRDGLRDLATTSWSAFAQDSYRRGRVSLLLGARFDRQDDRALAASIPANAILPDLLPAVHFPGADSDVVYRDWSPRASIEWDARGGGGTVLRAGVARYAGSGNATSRVLQPTGQTRLSWWWTDANGNGSVEREELDLARGPAGRPTPNYDPSSPSAPRTPATVDPFLENDRTEEVVVALDQRIGRAVGVRASYTWRKYHRLQDVFALDPDGSPVDSATFVPVRWTPSGCDAGAQCPPVVYYERGGRLPAATVLRNTGQRRDHESLDLDLRKRAGSGWSLSAAITWNRGARWFPRATRDYTDPTNIAMWNGREYSPLEARWVARFSGTARLPWGVDAAAFYAARGGFPCTRVVTSPARGALGSTQVHIKPFGSERYPDVHTLDARVARAFRVGRLRVQPTINVFNLLNSNTVLARNRVQNSASSNDVTDVLSPRCLRLDLAVSW